MALGFFVREIAKAVAISAGVEVLRERVIPPVAKKIKKKLQDKKESAEDTDSKQSNAKEYEAKWE